MSSISAGTASGTALVSTGDTSGALQLQVNGTTPSVTLAANGSIGVGSTPGYGTNGQVLTSSGTGSAPTWATPSGLAAATQVEMEAATSNTVAVTPLNTNFSPGVAKAWIVCSGDGTTINASHNITSITDTAVGRVTVTIATDFSSAAYSVITGVVFAGNSAQFVGVSNATKAAGSFEINCRNTSDNNADPQFYCATCFGDQA